MRDPFHQHFFSFPLHGREGSSFSSSTPMNSNVFLFSNLLPHLQILKVFYCFLLFCRLKLPSIPHEDHFPCSFPTPSGALEPLLVPNTLALIYHFCSRGPLLPVIGRCLQPIMFAGEIVRSIICGMCWLTCPKCPVLFSLHSESITAVKGTDYGSTLTPVGTSRAEKGDSSGVSKDEAVHSHPSLGTAKGWWLLHDRG